jgi:hypothetical protein
MSEFVLLVVLEIFLSLVNWKVSGDIVILKELKDKNKNFLNFEFL